MPSARLEHGDVCPEEELSDPGGDGIVGGGAAASQCRGCARQTLKRETAAKAFRLGTDPGDVLARDVWLLRRKGIFV